MPGRAQRMMLFANAGGCVVLSHSSGGARISQRLSTQKPTCLDGGARPSGKRLQADARAADLKADRMRTLLPSIPPA
eukprot:3806810-Prymnesium_polylepis.2